MADEPRSTDAATRYPVLDLATDLNGAWQAWKTGRPLEKRTITDLALLVEEFEARCTREFGVERVACWPGLALRGCDIRHCELAGKTLRSTLLLSHCLLLGRVDCASTRFLGKVNFSVATFAGDGAASEADFQGAHFAEEATFSGATFETHVDFMFARFEKDAHFIHTVFRREASFAGAVFRGEARFMFARFEQTLHLNQAQFVECLDLKDAVFEAAELVGQGVGVGKKSPVTLNVKHLRIGAGVLAGGLLLTRPQLGRLLMAGEKSDKTEELQSAIQQYSDLVGNFHAIAGPENYESEDYCRDKCLKLQHRLRQQTPAPWLRRCRWTVEWLVIHHCLGHFQKPKRILATMCGVIVLCGLLYAGAVPGVDLAVQASYGDQQYMTQSGSFGETLATAMYFSVVTFATVGYGDWHPEGWSRLVAALEGLSGVLLTAAFLVALSRRYIR